MDVYQMKPITINHYQLTPMTLRRVTGSKVKVSPTWRWWHWEGSLGQRSRSVPHDADDIEKGHWVKGQGQSHMTPMTLRRSLGQRSRSRSDGRRNLV